MDQYLTDSDARVLGALIEKQITTPDNYPLSLNSLVAACNQSSNRHPVVNYDEETVLGALQRLRRNSLVRGMQKMDSRVTKYEHLAPDVLDLDTNELAVLCVLLLRGPNTLGELRTRTERLAKFESLGQVEATLDALASREKDPPVVRLPRQPGQKEGRYAHLLSGEPVVEQVVDEPGEPKVVETGRAADERVELLEKSVAELRSEVMELRQQLVEFRKQFE
ncbi:MAG: YceH family protein [Gemmatimonas sp.]